MSDTCNNLPPFNKKPRKRISDAIPDNTHIQLRHNGNHDRHFLNAVTNTIIEVDQGRIRIFPGNYEYYLWRKNQDQIEKSERPEKTAKVTSQKSANTDYHLRKKLTNRLKKLPVLIAACEAAMAKQENILNDPSLASEYEKIQSAIDEKDLLEVRYLELLEELETLQEGFE